MEFLGKNKEAGPMNMDGLLYSALAAGDLPAAWLMTKPLVERAKTEQFSYATEFLLNPTLLVNVSSLVLRMDTYWLSFQPTY